METLPPIFLSYSRESSGALATAVASCLEPGDFFLDTAVMQDGDSISRRLLDAMLDARVLVFFFDHEFIARPYCQAEWLFGLARWEALRYRPVNERGVILILPPGRDDILLDRLPITMRDSKWPTQQSPEGIALLIRQQLALENSQPLRQLLSPVEASHLVHRSEALTMIPPRSRSLSDIPQFQLPPAPEGLFPGREELLRDLLQRLSNPLSQASVCLTGPGGSGKSRLAQEFVWRYGATYFAGGLFWLDASSPGNWSVQLHRLIQTLDPETGPLAKLMDRQVDLRQLLAELLHERLERRILFVLDNLPPGTAPRGPTGMLPSSLGDAALLITSRGASAPPSVSFPMTPLPRWASLELLTSAQATNQVALGLADQVAARLGDWPLALQLLHIALESGAITSHQLEQLLSTNNLTSQLDRTASLIQAALPTVTVQAVSESLQMSFDALDPADKELAYALCWCTDAPVPQEIIDGLESLGIAPTAASALRMRSWITSGSAGVYGRMHPVLADFLRTLPETEASQVLLARAIHAVQISASDTIMAHLRLQEQLAPHALALAYRETVPLQVRLNLLGEVAFLFCEQRRKEECLAVREEAWRLAQDSSLEGTEAPDLYLYELLNSLYVFAPERLSAEQLEDAIRGAASRLGETHKITLDLTWLLAKLYRLVVQEPLVARQMFTRLLEAYRAQPEPDYIFICATISEMSQIDWRRNELACAAQLNQEAYDLGRVHLGVEHSYTLAALHDLALTLMLLGAYREALGPSLRVLQTRTAQLGPLSPATLMSAHNHAELLYLIGKREESAALIEKVVSARAQILEPTDAGMLNSRGHLWRVRGVLGDPTAILELGALAILIRDSLDIHQSWSRKIRGFVAEIALIQQRVTAPDCDPERIVREELEASNMLVGQLAQMLITLGWQALQQQEAARFEALKAEALERIQGPLSAQHPFLLLLEAQSDLLAGVRPRTLEALAASLGTAHPEVQRVLQFVR